MTSVVCMQEEGLAHVVSPTDSTSMRLQSDKVIRTTTRLVLLVGKIFSLTKYA